MIRLATLLLTGATLAPITTQDDNSVGQGLRNPKVSDVVMLTFRPQHLDARSMYQSVQGMIGSNVMYRDEESGGMHQRSNLQLVGNALVLFDLPKAAERNYALLQQLDAEAGAADAGPAGQALITVEYAPRHLSVRTVASALMPFRDRALVSPVDEAGVAVLQSDPETVAEMRALLATIDVPAPQVLLTAYMITPAEESDGTLPGELIDGLFELTGIRHFKREAMGMVRSAVQANTRITILLEASRTETFELALIPATLDATGQTLTLSSCQLQTRTSDHYGHGAVLFQTSTSVESGRFTVLGAAGADPYFVVLQAAPANR